MGCLGNILWFLFGGLWQGLSWTLAEFCGALRLLEYPSGVNASSWRLWPFSPLAKRFSMAAVPFRLLPTSFG